jgi:(R,R)-butanediol dehydrogenase/meso-butanediol dehydrogenase/diacetyl reductase
MAILALRILGVKSITAIEMSEARIEAARRCGASDVINPSLENGELGMGDVPKGKGFDLVLECAGQPSSALLAGRITRTRGRLTLMGVFDKPTALDLTDIVFKEKLVIGSMSGYGLYKETIQMMANPLFQPELLITDRIGLDELIDEGYQGLLERKQRKIKTLVNPN